jgi:hypothetical protein
MSAFGRMQPSQLGRLVGIRIVTFEACTGFTHVTARRIAQPPEATFVTRLRPAQLPGQVARQLPDQSTTLRVEPSSTSDSRLRGARPKSDIAAQCGSRGGEARGRGEAWVRPKATPDEIGAPQSNNYAAKYGATYVN